MYADPSRPVNAIVYIPSWRVSLCALPLVHLLYLLQLASFPLMSYARSPPETRELRELVRFRCKLSNLRTGIKAQAHAVMAKNGILPCRNDMWGESGTAQFDALELPDAFDHRLAVLRDLVHYYDDEITRLDYTIHSICRDDPGYQAVQAIYGVGQVFAAVFVAEIGDVHRFDSPQALCSWAGLTPIHRESDGKVHRGRITKQGSRLVRWAAIEAVARYHGGEPFTEQFHVIAKRRGKTRANIAIARKVLTLVYYGLRDGEIRCLQRTQAA